MIDLGMIRPGETLDIPFATYDSNDPSASVTCTGLATTDIEIYKDGGLTQRASDAGYAVDTDFDAIVGAHSIQIDLANNTTAGFFAAGSKYVVAVASITVDAATINFWLARFAIGYPDAILNTTIATLASQTSFTLTKGPAENDALNGMWVVIHDVASGVQLGRAIISDYVGSTKTVTLQAGTTFTAAATDNISIMGLAPLLSGDPTAAANLEAMYDGTGYTDPTGPASRGQVDGLTGASGGSVNIQATEDNTGGAIIDGVTFVGSVQGGTTFTNTEAADGVVHDIDDTGNDIDIVYGFDVGGGRVATAVKILADVAGNNDEIKVKAYDHVGADWEIIGTIPGSGGSSQVGIDPVLLLKHTGTGSELGKVYIRFDTDSTTPSNLSVDHLIVSAVSIGQSVGYALGRIWIDTVNGVAGTEAFVNGVGDNRVNLIASAKTLSAAIPLSDFHITNGSTITLAESTVNESYFGDNWTLALGGQTVTGAHFEGANVSGIHVGACEFFRCEIASITTIAETHIEMCGMNGTVTLPVGNVYFDSCHHEGAFVLDFGAAVGSTTVHCHHHAGAIELQNFGDSGTDILHLDGKGKIVINANSSGGTINLRGSWEIEDNAGGATTINYDDLWADVRSLVSRIGSALFSGITSMAEWLGLIAGKQTGNATARTEIRATGAGSGTFDETADSNEAVRDKVNAIPTTAMRGTDSAALASVCTEARLAELAAANLPTDVDAIKVITDALTSAAAAKLATAMGAVVTGAAEAGTLSTTQMTTDVTETTDVHFVGRTIIWTSGVLKDQGTDITAYLGSTGRFTYDAVTEAPSAGDTFMIQ